MSQNKKAKRSTPIMVGALFVLTSITTAALGAAVYGFFIDGWLIPFWNGMTDAQAAIISQLIFFLAAAWASLLVPLLFGERLRSLEAAAAEAQATYEDIKRKLEESAVESRRQFSSISRYQQMSLGYFSSDGVLSEFDEEQKKAFVETAWLSVEPKLESALDALHGKTRGSISASGRYRSAGWWDRVKSSGGLGDCYDAFRKISDAKWSASRGGTLKFEQLVAVNEALKQIAEFEKPVPSPEAEKFTAVNPQLVLRPNGDTPSASLPQ